MVSSFKKLCLRPQPGGDLSPVRFSGIVPAVFPSRSIGLYAPAGATRTTRPADTSL